LWINIGNAIAAANGGFEFKDLNPAGFAQRFYLITTRGWTFLYRRKRVSRSGISSLQLEFADGKCWQVFSSQFFSNKKLVRKRESG